MYSVKMRSPSMLKIRISVSLEYPVRFVVNTPELGLGRIVVVGLTIGSPTFIVGSKYRFKASELPKEQGANGAALRVSFT
jgi:hypothetical protein